MATSDQEAARADPLRLLGGFAAAEAERGRGRRWRGGVPTAGRRRPGRAEGVAGDHGARGPRDLAPASAGAGGFWGVGGGGLGCLGAGWVVWGRAGLFGGRLGCLGAAWLVWGQAGGGHCIVVEQQPPPALLIEVLLRAAVIFQCVIPCWVMFQGEHSKELEIMREISSTLVLMVAWLSNFRSLL